MIRPIDFRTTEVIVEFGEGTGVITKRLLASMKPCARLLVFELNPLLYENLRKQITDSRMILINDNAQQLEQYLHQAGLSRADYIVSSLPLTNFSSSTLRTIC